MADLLLVDDDDDHRDLLSDLLVMDGHVVRSVEDGALALHALDQRFPQLVISDVEMPVLDGPAMVYRMFIENLGRENIPVILLSANPCLPDIAGAVGTPYYLGKPFEYQTFRSLLHRALGEARPPRPNVPC